MFETNSSGSQMDILNEGLELEYKEAVEFIQSEFPLDVFKNRNKYQKRHPLTYILSNQSKWQKLKIIAYANILQQLKSMDCNFQILKRKLVAFSDFYNEGIPFLEIAESFLHTGFNPSFIKESKNSRTPDILIVNTENKDIFYVEFTKFRDSESRIEISNSYRFLMDCFSSTDPFLPFTGIQKQVFTKESCQEIFLLIKDAKRKVLQEQKIVTFKSDLRLDFAMAPMDLFNEFKSFCEEHKLHLNNIYGIKLDFDETKRIINKIESKCDQFPLNSNTILYIEIHYLGILSTMASNFVSDILTCICKYKSLLGVVLYSTVLNDDPGESKEQDNHFYSRVVIGNCYSRDLIFIYNHNCQLQISNETLKQIYKTFKSPK